MTEKKLGPGREKTRREAAIAKRLKGRKRPPGMGTGKHAMNGNKFRFLHTNWHKRIIKEMCQSKAVQALVKSGKLDWILK